jgi:hypothetical protein
VSREVDLYQGMALAVPTAKIIWALAPAHPSLVENHRWLQLQELFSLVDGNSFS